MRSLEELNVAKKFVNVDLACFEFNADLYQNLTLFVEKLYKFYGEISISVDFEMSSFTEACLCVTLYNLPVFFKVNQNSLVRIATAPVDSNQNADVDDFWLKVDGCYMQKTCVGNDSNLDVCLDHTAKLMRQMSEDFYCKLSELREREVIAVTNTIENRINSLLWKAPLMAAAWTLLSYEREIVLNDLDFLLTLMVNTGLSTSILLIVDQLISKIKNE